MALPLVLASASPRRAALMTQVGLPFQVQVADIDETPLSREHPQAYVERLAKAKGQVVSERLQDHAALKDAVVISADTTVVVGDELLGKPANAEDGQQMLLRLSGRAHRVLTGLSVLQGTTQHVVTRESQVWLHPVSPSQAKAYWATGEPQDKAGGYGIQGIGGIFVDKIVGSYTNVVGLPVDDLERLLQAVGVRTWSIRGA